MASWDIVSNSGDFYLVLGRFKWGKIKDIIPGELGFLKVLGVDGEVQSVQLKDFDTQKSLFKDQFKVHKCNQTPTIHSIIVEEMKRPENQINIRSLKVTHDFAMNEKVMGFWKPEKKWYSATVPEKTKSGYKVVFADDNLVRVLSLQNLRKRHRDEVS